MRPTSSTSNSIIFWPELPSSTTTGLGLICIFAARALPVAGPAIAPAATPATSSAFQGRGGMGGLLRVGETGPPREGQAGARAATDPQGMGPPPPAPTQVV